MSQQFFVCFRDDQECKLCYKYNVDSGALQVVAEFIVGNSASRYGYDWKRDEAEKNLLRTHTTAVSSRMLYKLAQVGCILAAYQAELQELFFEQLYFFLFHFLPSI